MRPTTDARPAIFWTTTHRFGGQATSGHDKPIGHSGLEVPYQFAASVLGIEIANEVPQIGHSSRPSFLSLHSFFELDLLKE
jgi:hypothetical protein